MLPSNHSFFYLILGLSNHSMSNMAIVILLDFSLMLLCLLSLQFSIFQLLQEQYVVGSAIIGRAITIWEAIQKRIHEPIYKMDTKNEAKRLKATAFAIDIAYCKNYPFDRVPKIILYFGGNIIFFADCRQIERQYSKIEE